MLMQPQPLLPQAVCIKINLQGRVCALDFLVRSYMSKNLACCFTGYRPNKFPFTFGEGEEYLDLENKLIKEIFSLPEENCLTFYTGMAMGFDILAAELVLLLKSRSNKKIKLVCCLPFKEQQKGWDPHWQERYENIMQQADEAVLISDHYYKGCYFKRNEFMVDNSDIVLTFFDGTPGGTAQTLRYATKKGRRIINLARTDGGEFTYSDFENMSDIYFFEDE